MTKFISLNLTPKRDLCVQAAHIVSVCEDPSNFNKTVIRTVDGTRAVVNEKLEDVIDLLLPSSGPETR